MDRRMSIRGQNNMLSKMLATRERTIARKNITIQLLKVRIMNETNRSICLERRLLAKMENTANHQVTRWLTGHSSSATT